MSQAIVRYVGDRPFFLATADLIGRITFNRHNNFSQRLPVPTCEQIVKQWGKFFKIEMESGPGPLPVQTKAAILPVATPSPKSVEVPRSSSFIPPIIKHLAGETPDAYMARLKAAVAERGKDLPKMARISKRNKK